MTEMTVFGVCWRRFMFGYRSVPPATNCPTGPASAMIFTASATVCGTWYSNLGSRIIKASLNWWLKLSYAHTSKGNSRMNCYMRHLFAITTFRRSQHPQRFRPLNRRHGDGSKSTLTASCLVFQGLEHFLRCNWHFINSHAYRIVNGVRDSRWHWQQRTLTDFFRAVWSVWIRIFDEVGLYIAHL